MRGWDLNIGRGALVAAALSSLALVGCSVKPASGNNGNGNNCTFNVSGAVSGSGSCEAIAATDSGFWQVSITEDTGSSSFTGLSLTLSIDGSPTTGSYTQATMSSSICTLNTPNDKGDLANDWQEEGAPNAMGAVSVTINSLDQFASGDYYPHGSATFTLQGQGTDQGTVTGSVSF